MSEPSYTTMVIRTGPDWHRLAAPVPKNQSCSPVDPPMKQLVDCHYMTSSLVSQQGHRLRGTLVSQQGCFIHNHIQRIECRNMLQSYQLSPIALFHGGCTSPSQFAMTVQSSSRCWDRCLVAWPKPPLLVSTMNPQDRAGSSTLESRWSTSFPWPAMEHEMALMA